NNLLGYTFKNYPLDGVVNVKADKVDVNKFMGTTSDSTAKEDTASGPFIVPANLDLLLNAQAGKVKYDNLLMENVSGSLHLANQTVRLNNVKGNALDGTIVINGSYSTLNNKKKPEITLQYDVAELDIQKTFNTFVTVQKLMPIGKFLGGKLSSKLNLTGNLGENMFPDLTTLAGNGNVLLIEGLLQKFKPLEKLGEKLNVSELQNISLREIREQFEFSAGKVLVKPFKMKVKDIEMEIGGMHGFDQSLDYTIHLKVPRALMGSKANDLVNQLVTKASSQGVPVKVGETININAKMLGTITNPDIKLDLKETAGSVADEIKDQAKEFVQAKIDSSKKAVNDTLQAVKKEVIKEASERLKAELFGKKDSLSTDTGKKTNPTDRLKESGKGLIEDINPFKKKK
ncbi:MAG: AsmA-like C-terminal region-containing protein, partial [Chitinophagaceae bacterium]|nr:AsmA-like C-terminal region-containing protein [Chitinophagaceae bacterium]